MRVWACASNIIARGKVSFERGALSAAVPGHTPAAAGSTPHKPTQTISPAEKHQGDLNLSPRILANS
jgi:hypothetical protein